MGPSFAAVAALVLLASAWAALAQSTSCEKSLLLQNGTQLTFSQCQPLQVQGATLAWNYYPATNATNASATAGFLDVVFRSSLLTDGGWVGWGINPTGTDMPGTSALVAFTDSSTSSFIVLPFQLTTDQLQYVSPVAGPTEVKFLSTSVELAYPLVSIYARVEIQPGQTTINHIWNKGTSVSGRSPLQHDTTNSEYLTGRGTLDVTTGTVTTTGVEAQKEKQRRQNRHGVLNAISWGFLFPLGIIAARFMRPFAIFDPLWFYVHVSCQVSGYILGVAGWALGIQLINKDNIRYKHRNIGITLFVLATVQLTSLVLRPKPDHKWRKFWNVVHYFIGYMILILSIVNIFKGFDLLMPAKAWKNAYIGVLITLAAIALILEVITWIAWFTRRSRIPQRLENSGKGVNGHTENVTENEGNGNKGYNKHGGDL